MDTKTYSISDISASILSGGDAAKYDCLDSPTEEYNVPVFANAVANKGLYGYTNKSVVDKEAVTIAARGAGVGFIAYRKANFVPIVRLITIIPNEAYALAKFLYYYLSTQNIIGGGAAIPQLTVPMVKKIKVQLPPVYYQRRIASILSVYDNLIENNNKRIRLLEQMAENLYKEWFVRFRFPGHEKAEFENGLPKGWIIDRYSNVVNISAGGDKPKVYSEVPTLECNVPIYSNGIDKDGLYGYTDKAKINKPCITISARGTVGFVCLRRKPFVPIVRLLAVVPKNGISEYYLYFSSKYNDLEGNGTSQQQLTVPMLNKRKIMIPENRILLMFHEKMKLLFNQIDLLRNQSSILSRQRDLLLPRLMSGKLEVKV